jgi:hypothetical protein
LQASPVFFSVDNSAYSCSAAGHLSLAESVYCTGSISSTGSVLPNSLCFPLNQDSQRGLVNDDLQGGKQHFKKSMSKLYSKLHLFDADEMCLLLESPNYIQKHGPAKLWQPLPCRPCMLLFRC